MEHFDWGSIIVPIMFHVLGFHPSSNIHFNWYCYTLIGTMYPSGQVLPQTSVMGWNFLLGVALTHCSHPVSCFQVPPKFKYPFFWEINWYCLERYVNTLMGKSYLKPAPEGKRHGNSSHDHDNILPSGHKIERKDSTDSDKTIDIKQESSVKDEMEEEVDVEDDRSSTYDDPDTPKTEHSRSSTPTQSLTQEQNGHSTEHAEESSSQDAKSDNAKDGESKMKSCLCSFEKKGLSEMVRALANLPLNKRFVPDLITDADALLKDARVSTNYLCLVRSFY